MKILVISRGFPLKGFPSLIGGRSFSLQSFYETFYKKNCLVSVFIFPFKQKIEMHFPKGIHNAFEYRKYIGRNFIFIFRNILNFFKLILNQNHTLKDRIKIIFSKISSLIITTKMMNFYKIIKSYDEKYNFDVVLAYDSQISGQIGYLLKINENKKLVVISHGNDIIEKHNNLLTKMVLRKADRIIVRSKTIKQLVNKLYSIKMIKYLYVLMD